MSVQGVARLVQNAADAEDDDDEEEDDVPVKPSLSRPGKRGGRSAGAVGPPTQKKHFTAFRSVVIAWHCIDASLPCSAYTHLCTAQNRTA